MLMKSTLFLETLGPKCCNRCGEAIEELADCYPNTCFKCNDGSFYSIPLTKLETAQSQQ